MKKALITLIRFATGQAGITGPRYAPSSLLGRQDGSYLAELLLEKVYPVESFRYSTGGYEVHGIIRFIP